MTEQRRKPEKPESGGGDVWEDIAVVVVVAALWALAYHRFRPKVEHWLHRHHGLDLSAVVGSGTGWSGHILDIAAVVAGLVLLVALVRGWRRIRGRTDRPRKTWRELR